MSKVICERESICHIDNCSHKIPHRIKDSCLLPCSQGGYKCKLIEYSKEEDLFWKRSNSSSQI